MIISMDNELEKEVSNLFEEHKRTALTLRTSTAKDRIAKLKKLEQWIHSHRKDIHQALYDDFNKPEEEVDIGEIYPVLSEIRHIKSHLRSWMKPEKVDVPLTMLGSRPYIHFEPKGTTLIIAPWNYPLGLLLSPFVYAIAAGNSVILKPSEMTPHTSTLLAEMVNSLFDKNEVALYEGGVQLTTVLLKLPFDHIFFTGSPTVGKIVMKAAAANLTSVTLELGGKSPTIVDKTANIKATAKKIAWGKFFNAGQTCIAPDYLLVHESVKTKLIDEMKKSINEQFGKGSDQYKHSHAYARIVNEKHHSRLQDMIKDAKGKGGELVIGGEIDKNQNFISPTLIDKTSKDMQITNDEIFGPIMPILTYSSLDEVISYINERPKPLALYIFSNSNKNINYVLQNTSSGTSCANDTCVQYIQCYLPFGGVNTSGIGKSHSIYGFKSFSNEKAVIKQLKGWHIGRLIYPPYSNFSKWVIDILVKYL